MKLDGFHFALIALIVLLAIYFGGGFVREAMTKEQARARTPPPLTPADKSHCGGGNFCVTGGTSPEGLRGCFKNCKHGGRWGNPYTTGTYCCNPHHLQPLPTRSRIGEPAAADSIFSPVIV